MTNTFANIGHKIANKKIRGHKMYHKKYIF